MAGFIRDLSPAPVAAGEGWRRKQVSLALATALMVAAAWLSLVIFSGCGAKQTVQTEQASRIETAGMKTCFNCNGTGKIKCLNCQDGLAVCPAGCIKATDPGWHHMEAPGHPASDIWFT